LTALCASCDSCAGLQPRALTRRKGQTREEVHRRSGRCCGSRCGSRLLGGRNDANSVGAGGFGSFQVVCRSSHTNSDDPIVFPRRPGAAHQHDFFGNVSTNAYSTNASLAGKRTTCSRPGDTAAYWTPALLNNGRRVEPDRLIAYYRTRGIRNIDSNPPVPPRSEDDRRVIHRHGVQSSADQDSRTGTAVTAFKAQRRSRRPAPASPYGFGSSSLTAGTAAPWTPPTTRVIWLTPVEAAALRATQCPCRRWSSTSAGRSAARSAGCDCPPEACTPGMPTFWNAWNQSAQAQLVRNCLNAGRGVQQLHHGRAQPVT
jgi:hypothetical protein